MTCGACDPESFRTAPEARTMGYVVAWNSYRAAHDARRLHYLGAELVMADVPGGQVLKRPALSALLDLLRAGDTIILASLSCLGADCRTARTNHSVIEAGGITIQIMNPEYFEHEP